MEKPRNGTASGSPLPSTLPGTLGIWAFSVLQQAASISSLGTQIRHLSFSTPQMGLSAARPGDAKSRGGTNCVFGKPCLCPLPKRGRFDENGENDEVHSTH